MIPPVLVFPDDVHAFTAGSLDPATRARVGAEPDDLILTRPNARRGSMVVGAGAAPVVLAFRRPATLVAAVIRGSGVLGADPEQLLEDVYPVVARLVRARLLVAAGTGATEQIHPSLREGDRVGVWRVGGCVQAMIDTEVYRATGRGGRAAAVKLRGPGRPPTLRSRWAGRRGFSDGSTGG